MEESFLVAVFLTLAGGFQDSYSYVARGKVFCNAQTGNIVLLAGNLFSGNVHAIGKYLIPLLAFVLGVYIAVRIEFHFQRSKVLVWQQAVLLIEMLSMLIAGFLPANLHIVANSLLSFSCAMQVTVFNRMEGLTFASTMCIGNLRSASWNWSKYHLTKDKAYRHRAISYYSIIAIFALGAVLGFAAAQLMALRAICLAPLFLLVPFLLLFWEERDENERI
jgi:uncharacterized membrane protein YoaK (UPF0700 family)